MDIFFSEPDENNNLRFIERMEQETHALGLREPRLAQLLNEAREAADNDSILAAAIRRSKSPVVLGYSGNIRPSAVKLVQFTSPQAQQVKVREALLPESNIAKLAKASRLAGHLNISTDIDGKVRWIPLVIRYQDRFYPALSLQAVRYSMGNIPLQLRVADHGIATIQLGPVAIPTTLLGGRHHSWTDSN
jgi:hypothetical protein